jgi:hypothetical protein
MFYLWGKKSDLMSCSSLNNYPWVFRFNFVWFSYWKLLLSNGFNCLKVLGSNMYFKIFYAKLGFSDKLL